MNWKRITYGGHAADRLRERRITRQQVRNIIASGEDVPTVTHPGKEPRSTKVGLAGKRQVYVTYIERKDEIHVVTVAIVRRTK